MTEQEKQKRQMIDDEYGGNFGGCLWMVLAAIIGLTIFGVIYLFT